MAKEIRYTMTTREALLKALDLVLATNIAGLKEECGPLLRKQIATDDSEGTIQTLSFQWELAFAIGVTMYVEFKDRWHSNKDQPAVVKVSFSYSGTHHDINSAMAINDLQQKVVAVGSTIAAVLSRETIKSAHASWDEEHLEKDRFAARTRYQQHLTRKAGATLAIKLVDKHDIGFMIKDGVSPSKEVYLCGAPSVKGSAIPCKNKAKTAIWLGRAWGARCGRHESSLDDRADPVVDILEEYKNDYGKEFLMSKDEEDAAPALKT